MIKLVDEVRIEQVKLIANINEANVLGYQTFEITMLGKDENGIQHEQVITLHIDLQNFNVTTPDTIDLQGKNIQVIKPEQFKN
jgi:hypothetical protein